MPIQRRVVNVVYHYSQDALITCNQAELNSALDDGWQFKSAAPNYAAMTPYMLNSPYLGMSYLFEKADESENQLK